jgi:hypothetical protein
VARQAARLIAAAFLALLATAAVAEGRSAERIKPTPWSQLRPEEQRILGPIADRWASMPGLQQQRLISSARKYPSLQPIQKERFDARLRSWAEMSPEQRREARETYQGLRRLPPAQQHELRERWLQRHQQGEESSEPNFDRPPPPGPTRERPPPGPTRPDYTREPRSR